LFDFFERTKGIDEKIILRLINVSDVTFQQRCAKRFGVVLLTNSQSSALEGQSNQ
jgi:hypothetical protein